MTTQTLFREYIWLVNTIRRARKITFADLQEKWLDTEMSEGVELARATFNRHKDAIEDIFGILIECDRRDGYKYYIGNDRVLREDTVQNWMLSTLTVNQIVSESLSLQKRIMLEQVPYESGYLETVIEAMKKSRKLNVTYLRYGSSEGKELLLEPYCIKLFKRRWYLIAHFHRPANENHPDIDYVGNFSFDRMEDLTVSEETFRMDPDFSAEKYFRDYWGVMVSSEIKLERIIIRAYNNERYYMEDLPLHESQREIAEGENYTDYELRLHPTMDFCGHLLSRSSQIKILSPEWLAKKIKQMHLDAAARYQED